MELLKYFKKLKWEFLLVLFLIIVNAGFLTLAGISSANALSAVAKLRAAEFFMWGCNNGWSLYYLCYC